MQQRFAVTMLAGEHQLEQRGVLDRETRVLGRGGTQSADEIWAGLPHRRAQREPESFEAGLRQGIEQGLAIRKVTTGRAMADAGLAGQLT